MIDPRELERVREQVEHALRDRLGPAAIIDVSPSRDWRRLNLWVVSPEVTPHVLEELPAGLRPDEDIYNVVQVFASPEEAVEFGLPPSSMSPQGRPDWISRAGLVAGMQTVVSGDPRLERPVVVTFYSYRGGVGRTTALAHTAAIIAARGRRVLLLDADFEAPGLHHTFGIDHVRGHPLLRLFQDVQREAVDQGGMNIDVREYLQRVDGYADCYLLSPGDPDPDYLTALASLDIGSWPLLPVNPAYRLLDLLIDSELRPDVIFVDARTGLAESSAPFLLGGTDHAVVCFYPSEQSRVGTEFVVNAIRAAPTRRGAPVGLHFVATPLPSSRAASIDPTLLELGRTWAARWVSDHVLVEDVDGDEIDFQPIAYSSAIALTDRIVADPILLAPYTALADWLDPVDEPVAEVRDVAAIRAELEFNAGNSDDPGEAIEEIFVETKDSRRVDDARMLLVVGRKGTGKTTLFRRLLTTQNAVAVTTPESLRAEAWWPAEPAWRRVAEVSGGLTIAWPLLIALRLTEERERAGAIVDVEAAEALRKVRARQANGFLEIVRETAQRDDGELDALTLLDRAASALATIQRVVFDGLDTAFGYTSRNRDLRREALTHLMSLVLDRESSLRNLAFTIFLRTDVEEELNFVNRSHLFGRTLTLSWERSAYLKTVLKQAVRSSPTFSRLIETLPENIDEISDDRTLDVWRELVGTRVRGKQTTFTDRWVWARLADGNGDHSPRHLSQLFRVLADRARARVDEPGPPLRARDFGSVLEQVVSPEALRAVSDEFDEELVGEVRSVLQRLARTPFMFDEWEQAGGHAQLLEQAGLMGLVAPHPRDREPVIPRLVVPELYRYALGIRRMGPA